MQREAAKRQAVEAINVIIEAAKKLSKAEAAYYHRGGKKAQPAQRRTILEGLCGD